MDGDGFRALVLGIGGAGCRIIEQIAETPLPGMEYIAIDTDCSTLARVKKGQTFQLASSILHGFGTGTDRLFAERVANNEKEALRKKIKGYSILFVIAGMGSGVGAGVSTVVVKLAREENIFTTAIAIHPFECEGSNRLYRAYDDLSSLYINSSLLISLQNQLLVDPNGEQSNFQKLYKLGNNMVSEAIIALWDAIRLPGILPLDLGRLHGFYASGQGGIGRMAIASAWGDNRMIEIWNGLKNNRSLNFEDALAKANRLLVIFVGDESISIQETEILKRNISRVNSSAEIILGVASTGLSNGELKVILIATPQKIVKENNLSNNDNHNVLSEEDLSEKKESVKWPTRLLPPAPPISKEFSSKIKEIGHARGRRSKLDAPGQGMLNFSDSVIVTTKGRFDNCEPTLDKKGWDLDIPTYRRLNMTFN